MGKKITSAPTGQRDVVVDAAEAVRHEAEIAAQALQAEHHKNVLAQNLGLSSDNLNDLVAILSPEARARVMGDTTRVENFDEHTEQGMWDGDAPLVTIDRTVLRNRDKRSLEVQAKRHEERMFTYLYDPPRGDPPMHYSMSRCHINMAKYLMAEQNFHARPIAPIYKPGPIACEYISMEGIRCPKDGFHTVDQLDLHQRTKHRQWYAMEEYRRQRDQVNAGIQVQQNTLAIQQAQLEEMRQSQRLNLLLLKKLGLSKADIEDPDVATALVGDD